MNEWVFGERGTSFPPWHLLVMWYWANHPRSAVSLHKMKIRMLRWSERKRINQMLCWNPSQKTGRVSHDCLWVFPEELRTFSPAKCNGIYFHRAWQLNCCSLSLKEVNLQGKAVQLGVIWWSINQQTPQQRRWPDDSLLSVTQSLIWSGAPLKFNLKGLFRRSWYLLAVRHHRLIILESSTRMTHSKGCRDLTI